MANVLIWSDRAAKEYDQLVTYLSEYWSEDIALRVMLEIDETVLNIQNSPELYPVFSKRKKIRRCVASPQTSIYFKLNNNHVEILAMFDNRQNPKKLKL